MFKNMKIEINEQQPLDEVVKELERLGYIPYLFFGEPHINFIATMDNTYTDFGSNELCDAYCGVSDLTTLAELKDMPLNDFGFDFKQQPSNTVELGMQMLEEGVK